MLGRTWRATTLASIDLQTRTNNQVDSERQAACAVQVDAEPDVEGDANEIPLGEEEDEDGAGGEAGAGKRKRGLEKKTKKDRNRWDRGRHWPGTLSRGGDEACQGELKGRSCAPGENHHSAPVRHAHARAEQC